MTQEPAAALKILRTIQQLLNMHRKDIAAANPVAIFIQEQHGEEKIDAMLRSNNVEVATLANEILESFFLADVGCFAISTSIHIHHGLLGVLCQIPFVLASF